MFKTRYRLNVLHGYVYTEVPEHVLVRQRMESPYKRVVIIVNLDKQPQQQQQASYMYPPIWIFLFGVSCS